MNDAQTVKEGLFRRLPGVVEALYGKRARWQTNEWRLSDVWGAEGASLAIEGHNRTKVGVWIDYATDESGDIFDLIQEALETDFRGALAWAWDFLGPDYQPLSATFTHVYSPVPVAEREEPPGMMSSHSLQGASEFLWANQQALRYLYDRGLTQATIEYFHLGLSSYEKASNPFKDALSFPLLDAAGIPRKRWLRYKIPGVTKGGPEKSKGWASGSAGVYWVTPSEGRTSIFVCEGAKDGWWLWQAIQGTPLEGTLCIVTSTHGSVMPAAWKDPEFWQGWEQVYLGQDVDDAGDTMASKLRESAARDVRRVRVPDGQGKDWTDFFQGGRSVSEFQKLLSPS